MDLCLRIFVDTKVHCMTISPELPPVLPLSAARLFATLGVGVLSITAVIGFGVREPVVVLVVGCGLLLAFSVWSCMKSGACWPTSPATPSSATHPLWCRLRERSS